MEVALLSGARAMLSKEEIEALLRPDLSDMDGDSPKMVEAKPIPSFAVSDELKERAQKLTADLSLALRSRCSIEAAARPLGARMQRFADAASSLAQDSAIMCFGPRSKGVSAMLVMEPALANGLVEIAFGGRPDPHSPALRKLTALDAEMIFEMLAPAAAAFGAETAAARVETRMNYAAALAPPGQAVVLDMAVTLGDLETRATLIVSEPGSVPGEAAQRVPEREMTAVVTARLASLSVPASRISRLKPGDTLLLGLPPDQPVSLLSGGRDGKLAAEGDIGRKGGSMAVRIKSVKG